MLRSFSDVRPGLDALLPGILKVSRLGYDGKGQRRLGELRQGAPPRWDRVLAAPGARVHLYEKRRLANLACLPAS